MRSGMGTRKSLGSEAGQPPHIPCPVDIPKRVKIRHVMMEFSCSLCAHAPTTIQRGGVTKFRVILYFRPKRENSQFCTREFQDLHTPDSLHEGARALLTSSRSLLVDEQSTTNGVHESGTGHQFRGSGSSNQSKTGVQFIW
ncbi:hypothetical protein QL285_026391 [Trifolium repens]|nr:hypothetical protein QL285_026391 [Trifolium repens]